MFPCSWCRRPLECCAPRADLQLTVLAVKALVDYAIPDVPSKIRMQLQRERYLARQAVVQRSDPTPRPAPAGAAAASALRRDSDRSRGTDTDSLAYQGEDVIEAEGALRGRTLPLEKLRYGASRKNFILFFLFFVFALFVSGHVHER